MSHVPERPLEFVCENCHLIYAGTVVRSDGERHYEAPTHCATCHSETFVELTEYSRTG